MTPKIQVAGGGSVGASCTDPVCVHAHILDIEQHEERKGVGAKSDAVVSGALFRSARGRWQI